MTFLQWEELNSCFLKTSTKHEFIKSWIKLCVKLHPLDDEDPRIGVKMRERGKKGKNGTGDRVPHLFLSTPILLSSCCSGYLVLTPPQKPFIPMEELFEDW